MKTDNSLDTGITRIYLSNIVKAEARKALDTKVSKIIIGLMAFLTIIMLAVAIFTFEDGD